MNGTPRLLNRVLLAVIGLALLVSGVLAIVLAAVPAAGPWWQARTASLLAAVDDALARTQAPGGGSWLWFAAAAVLVLVIVLMVAWVANQGKGRADVLAASFEAREVAGKVVISGALAEQALKAALAERTDLVSSSVQTYEVQGRTGLKIRLLPRQGVSPQALAADVSELVEALDAALGVRTPVLISIGAGTRSKLGRAERVR
ncbi:hypothetical protein KIH31_12360 [Paenarthrobacter sp. DKR-5]|uniref:hypothetical protein n=1 Tax=Paenarthrobacter sp. DKR-5 TaxID=2835535 RepID=UPI001BDBC716|nr:hypothetical protein [Paenarthrobacter sp. DKR-5]MBT1003396.1 hypothetical protein [Paenarthrobacter sp. DKR-5]